MAGEISIGGEINTKGIETGLGRIEKGFDDVATAGKSVNADFVRINQQATKLANKLTLVGIAGVVGITSLTKGAPALAGAFARMGIEAGKLQRSLGSALKPAFDLAAEGMASLASWVERNREGIRDFTDNVISKASSGLSTLGGIWRDIESVTKKLGIDIDLGGAAAGLTLPIAAGLMTTLITKNPAAGLAVAGGAGLLTAQTPGGRILAGAAVGGGIGALVGSVVPGIGTLIGAGVGAVGGGIAAALGQLIGDIIIRNRRKNASVTVLDTIYL